MRETIPQKTEHAAFTSKVVRKGFVSVCIDKNKSESLCSDLHFALAWALKQAGIMDVDVTFRESDDRIEVVVET